DAEQRTPDRRREREPVLPVGPEDPLPEEDADRADRPEDAPERDARAELAPEDATPMPQADLLQGERADEEGRRLRAAVAAARDDERDEDREDDRLREVRLVADHRRRRQHLPEEQDDEPARALADQLPKRRREIGLVERFRATDFVDV